MIASVADEIADGALTNRRPFRSPYHSASMPALVGGGARPAIKALCGARLGQHYPPRGIIGNSLFATGHDRLDDWMIVAAARYRRVALFRSVVIASGGSMDMSVSMPAAREQDNAPQKAASVDARPAAVNASDLEIWLQKVEAMGELKRITAEVDPNLEAATITYLVGSEKSPALLFENIKGHPGHKALYNMIGCNLSRFCLMIGEKPVDHPLKAVQILQQKLGRKMPPREVPAAAFFLRSGCGRSTAACISAPAMP
jgi:3-octaprenyl-4-hydroxybenzoate carboxy-lyase/Magnesium chelatase, subunit ChlI